MHGCSTCRSEHIGNYTPLVLPSGTLAECVWGCPSACSRRGRPQWRPAAQRSPSGTAAVTPRRTGRAPGGSPGAGCACRCRGRVAPPPLLLDCCSADKQRQPMLGPALFPACILHCKLAASLASTHAHVGSWRVHDCRPRCRNMKLPACAAVCAADVVVAAGGDCAASASRSWSSCLGTGMLFAACRVAANIFRVAVGTQPLCGHTNLRQLKLLDNHLYAYSTAIGCFSRTDQHLRAGCHVPQAR